MDKPSAAIYATFDAVTLLVGVHDVKLKAVLHGVRLQLHDGCIFLVESRTHAEVTLVVVAVLHTRFGPL